MDDADPQPSWPAHGGRDLPRPDRRRREPRTTSATCSPTSRAAALGRLPSPRGRAHLRRRHRRSSVVGSAVRRAAPGRAAPVPGVRRGDRTARRADARATCSSTSAPHRLDLCFELPSGSWTGCAGSAAVVDEVHGFRSFDERDLLGFVDGTENPDGRGGGRAVTDRRRGPGVRRRQLRRRAEVPARPDGLERAAGRGAGARRSAARSSTTSSCPTTSSPPNSHVALNTIADDGRRGAADRARQHAVRQRRRRRVRHLLHRLRPHARRSSSRCCSNMFVGDPPGNHDRILDFSTAVTGACSSCPTPTSSTTRPAPTPTQSSRGSPHRRRVPTHGSLGIGVLGDRTR